MAAVGYIHVYVCDMLSSTETRAVRVGWRDEAGWRKWVPMAANAAWGGWFSCECKEARAAICENSLVANALSWQAGMARRGFIEVSTDNSVQYMFT